MGMGGGARVGYGLMRSMRQDDKIKNHKLPKGIVRRVLGFARPYTAALVLFLVLIVIDALVGAVNPLLTRAIINELVGAKNSTVVVELAVAMAGLFIFDAALGLWERWISSRVGEGLIFDMRNKVFNHIQRMPIAFFTRTQTGALISRLNNDVLGAQQAFTDTFNSVIGNMVSCRRDPCRHVHPELEDHRCSLCCMLPVFIFPARWVGKRLAGHYPRGLQPQRRYERHDERALQCRRCAPRQDFRAGRSTKLTCSGQDGPCARHRRNNLHVRPGLLYRPHTHGISRHGSRLWLRRRPRDPRGLCTVGTLVAMTQYLTRLYGPLTSLSNVQVDVLTALVSFDRVFEVLDLPPMIDDKPDASTVEHGPTEVAFDNVDFSYPRPEEVSLASLESVAVLERSGGQQILFDVSFVAEPGQLVALVGPSGAGKTTISHLSARLYDVTSGSVKINGVDVRDVTLSSLQEAIGVVTQEAHLFHDTFRANLLYARPEATEEELVNALRDAQILDMVTALPDGLDTLVGDRGYRLSGGEKQRVAIARLLLKAPDFVVLDEATAHLDSESEVAVQRALKKVLAGRTSLVIAHRLSTVRDADQILVIEGGQVVERGRHAELLANGGLYAELYHTQFADQDEIADETDGDIEELGEKASWSGSTGTTLGLVKSPLFRRRRSGPRNGIGRPRKASL